MTSTSTVSMVSPTERETLLFGLRVYRHKIRVSPKRDTYIYPIRLMILTTL